MPVNISNPADLKGVAVTGSEGEKLGKVDEVYLDNTTSAPEWVSVKTGLFGSSTALVPIAAANWDGSELTVPFSKDVLKGAPHHDPGYEISESDEAELFTYYGITDGADTATGVADGVDTTTTGTGYAETTRDVDTGTQGHDTGTQGHDTSGPNTDDAMTRSEERLHVGTESRVAGTARLRKFITSETVTRSVPVSREEVSVQREPITEANRDSALSGGDLTEEVHEVTLHEERPVAVKETVPVERVKLGTDTVTEQAEVTEEVRKENIEVLDGSTPRVDER